MRTIRLWSSMTWEGSLPTTAGISASSWRDARPSPLAFTRAILRGLQRYPCAIPISSDPTRVGCARYDSLVLPHDRWGEATLARLHLAGDERVIDFDYSPVVTPSACSRAFPGSSG